MLVIFTVGLYYFLMLLVKPINQKPVNIFSQNFAHMFTILLLHILSKQEKKIMKVPPEFNMT